MPLLSIGDMPRLSKSLAHLQIQLHLKSLISSLFLEKKVKNRIADTLWEERKIVFEIQCSPLSLQEAQTRCQDYLSYGYTPVWILHDREFNKKRASPAELYLRSHTTTYFTNGSLIYDQFDLFISLKRAYKGPPLPINLTRPQQTQPLPERSWPLSFQGDFLHWAQTHDTAPFRKLLTQRRQRPWKTIYKFLLYRLLEFCS